MTEAELYADLEATRGCSESSPTPHPITDFVRLVRRETWQQRWDLASRSMAEQHDVAGNIWSDAIAACLAEHGSAYIPKLDEPVYIDRSIVLGSGQRLIAHPEAEICFKPGVMGAPMVRNASFVFAPDNSVTMCEGADEDILVEGGIWSNQNNDGHGRGASLDGAQPIPGANGRWLALGMFLLSNVRRVTVRNLQFRDCASFAVQIGNAEDFVIENLVFDETADGVHVEGPSKHGIVRGMSGKTNDDVVALNAWDWDSSSVTFGPITDILVEDVVSPSGYTWSEIRLLPGIKTFAGGESVECQIERCLFRNIRGVHTFKLYDQPNCHRPDKDFSDPIGRMSDLFFSGIEAVGIAATDYYDTSSDALFDICADIDRLSTRDLRLAYTPGQDDMAPYLVSVGPKSMDWDQEKRPGEGWRELFNPNASPTLRGLSVTEVRLSGNCRPLPVDQLAGLVHERQRGSARGTIANPDLG